MTHRRIHSGTLCWGPTHIQLQVAFAALVPLHLAQLQHGVELLALLVQHLRARGGRSVISVRMSAQPAHSVRYLQVRQGALDLIEALLLLQAQLQALRPHRWRSRVKSPPGRPLGTRGRTVEACGCATRPE